MERNITLSYLIVTRNKLPYLKVTIEKLIAFKKTDENILIADGASTDGTKEYLEDLKRQNKVDFYVSEPDYGVPHALNKLILKANGTLLKFITDDDYFDYTIINKCKEFMLTNTKVDIVNTEGGVLTVKNITKTLHYSPEFKKWKSNGSPFSFCELGMMIRRSSLPILGLRSMFIRNDMEFSLRVTSSKVNIAWYTGYSYVNIMNPQSVSLVHMKKIGIETDRLNQFYLGKNPDIFILKKIKVIRNKLRMILRSRKQEPPKENLSFPMMFSSAEKWIEYQNKTVKPQFI